MKNKKTRKATLGGSLAPAVHFEFTHPTAVKVCVAGTFNDWRPEATPMVWLGNGCWRKKLVLPPGRYEYCLVVDGEWMPDLLAKETVPNPFGSRNAVIRVPAPPEQSTGSVQTL